MYISSRQRKKIVHTSNKLLYYILFQTFDNSDYNPWGFMYLCTIYLCCIYHTMYQAKSLREIMLKLIYTVTSKNISHLWLWLTRVVFIWAEYNQLYQQNTWYYSATVRGLVNSLPHRDIKVLSPYYNRCSACNLGKQIISLLLPHSSICKHKTPGIKSLEDHWFSKFTISHHWYLSLVLSLISFWIK